MDIHEIDRLIADGVGPQFRATEPYFKGSGQLITSPAGDPVGGATRTAVLAESLASGQGLFIEHINLFNVEAVGQDFLTWFIGLNGTPLAGYEAITGLPGGQPIQIPTNALILPGNKAELLLLNFSGSNDAVYPAGQDVKVFATWKGYKFSDRPRFQS